MPAAYKHDPLLVPHSELSVRRRLHHSASDVRLLLQTLPPVHDTYVTKYQRRDDAYVYASLLKRYHTSASP